MPIKSLRFALLAAAISGCAPQRPAPTYWPPATFHNPPPLAGQSTPANRAGGLDRDVIEQADQLERELESDLEELGDSEVPDPAKNP